jgi:hypothetical protein
LATFLELGGKGADHQIAAEPRRRSDAMHLAPSKPQLVGRASDQSSDLAFNLGHVGAARSLIPLAALIQQDRRPARMLAGRQVVDWGFHGLAGSAMR